MLPLTAAALAHHTLFEEYQTMTFLTRDQIDVAIPTVDELDRIQAELHSGRNK